MIAVFLGMMIVLVFMNVIGRYVFNVGFVWSEELARLCFIFLVYLGSIEAMRDNRHLMIDTLMLKVPKLFQIILYALTQICIIFVMALLTRGAWGMVLQNLHNVWIVTGFPSYIVHFFGCLLGVSVILISGFNLVRLVVFKIPVTELIKIRSGEDESAELRTD
jgi:TRAP-type C4-dicarboxylate transport system permease small subunit